LSRRKLYTPASLLVGALVVMGLAFAGQATTQASTPADASSRAMSVTSQGELPEILKDMPEDMKKNHGKYDNRLTALYEQWLDGSYNKVFNPAASIPNPIFSPLYGPDVDMSTLTTAENEYQIDINPLNHLNAVGGSNDGMTAGVGIYRTTDGGFSWSSVDASVYGTGAACCDPAVAFGADGAVYVGILRTASPAGQITLKSTDGGASFTQLPFLPLPDRNNIATHPTNANILYVTYFDSPSGSIRGYRSTDAGASWSPNFRISDTTPASGYQQSSQPRVHSDGTVYVGYQEYLNSSQGCNAGVRNEVSKSTDMGQTWTVTGFDIQQGGACTSQQVGRGIFCINSGGSSFRSRSHPILGLHPTNSNIVYTVYSGGELETAYTCGSATGKHGDTLFRKSTDAGATWSAPSRINTDPVGWDQYYPWVDVAPNGTIWAGWHDRREDPNNFQHRWYQSYSTDEGATWRKIDGTIGNDPVADTMSQPSTFIGDYAGLAAENDRVLPMWWDSRNGSDPYTDPYVPVQGTPTATVTGTPPTATRTSTATNTAIVTPSSTRTSTATPDPCAGNYMVTPTTGATIVPGTTDTGNHCDDCVTSVTLPFPFRLYDQTYNSVTVSSNGNAQFVGSLTDYTNTCLPAAGFTYTIFPYWDDLRTDTGANCPTGGCGVFTSISGTAPNRIFNIEWRAVLFSGGALANFELRLYEATPSRFDVIYGANPGNTSATGGVQRNSTQFTQAFCNGTGQATTAGTMLQYSQPPCTPGTVTTPGTTSTAMTATTTATRTGTAMPSMTGTMMPTMTGTMMPTMTRTSTVMPSMTSTMMPTGTMMPSMTATMMATGTMMPTRTAVPCNGRITVCHRTGNGNSHSISISCSALNAHLNHGDTVGPCPAATRTPRANPFRDISTGDYFYEHTLDLRYAEAIGGYNDGTFRPYNQATRAQLVKIVVLAFDIPLYNGSEQSFSDVPRDHPFYQYIMTAKRDNIITGYNDGTFRPYANVTRGQIAKIAVESARMADLSSDGPSFRDVPTNHTFFRHIETAYANGILSGYADGTFRPDADATRGQITKIVNLATHPGTGPNR